MARIQIIQSCSLLLAVITYYDHILLTEGRPIKSLSEHEFSSIDSRPATQDDPWSATPPPRMPNYRVGFGDSTAVYEDDFRPTPPGNSPGVGHHFVPNKEDIPPKAPVLGGNNGERLSVTAYKDDYRPTEPGHSPGVGHSLLKTNAEPKPNA